jgi:hypothetical protein
MPYSPRKSKIELIEEVASEEHHYAAEFISSTGVMPPEEALLSIWYRHGLNGEDREYYFRGVQKFL